MDQYDYPNEQELQPYKVYNYDLTGTKYPISDNNAHSTYDQFLSLRDTLIYSKKKYSGKRWAKLVIWDKEETVEVIFANRFKLWFQPNYSSDPTTINKEILWWYVTWWTQEALWHWYISWMIERDGRYRIIHKEEVILSSSTDKVFCYVDVYRQNSQWVYEIPQDMKWWIAVFDWEWAWWAYRIWDLFKKITAFWIIERDLYKWDILVLRMRDATYNTSTWEPQWNELNLQQNSNYLSIEYIDLALK